jgi:hypothetical protein
MEVFSINGQRQYQNFNNKNVNWMISPGVQALHFHFYTKTRYKTNPFEIIIKDGVSSINTLSIIISIASIVTSCFAITVLFIRCSKKIIQSRIERNLGLQQNDARINIINGYEGRTQEEILKMNKEILDKIIASDLKPNKYSDDLNKYLNNCTICLEDFTESSDVVVIQCKHIFHLECLKDWLLKNLLNPKCPNCNYNVLLGKEINIQINGEIVEENRVLNLNSRNNPGQQGQYIAHANFNNNYVNPQPRTENNGNSVNAININYVANHPHVINFEITNNRPIVNDPNVLRNNNLVDE